MEGLMAFSLDGGDWNGGPWGGGPGRVTCEQEGTNAFRANLAISF